MKFEREIRLLLVPLVLATFHCQSKTPGSLKNYHKDLDPYVHFLKNGQKNPVDYVMDLFEDNDIIIFCERAHPEVTQYDLILRLVSDQRFIDDVGHIFTEVGVRTRDEDIDHYLTYGYLNEKDAERDLLFIYRNISFHPVWNNSNFYEFLKKLRLLNMSLPSEKKVKLHFSDVPFEWEGMTKEEYRAFQDMLPGRDRIMADHIIEKFSAIQHSVQKRKKALVIMNFRHAFNDRFEKPGGEKGDNVGRYLFGAFPGKAANVLINSVRILPGTTDQEVIMAPVQDGKWDAAFAVMGNPAAGFDFESSPFGRDEFDMYPLKKEGLSYQDVFTGFIFHVPLEEHQFLSGIPALFDDGFEDMAVSRYVLTGRTLEDAKHYVQEGRKNRESSYSHIQGMAKTIHKWIAPVD